MPYFLSDQWSGLLLRALGAGAGGGGYHMIHGCLFKSRRFDSVFFSCSSRGDARSKGVIIRTHALVGGIILVFFTARRFDGGGFFVMEQRGARTQFPSRGHIPRSTRDRSKYVLYVKGAPFFLDGLFVLRRPSFFSSRAFGSAGQGRGASVQDDACLDPGRAPWRVPGVFKVLFVLFGLRVSTATVGEILLFEAPRQHS